MNGCNAGKKTVFDWQVISSCVANRIDWGILIPCFFKSWLLRKATVDMVVYPIIYNVLYIPGGCLGFLNHQQSQFVNFFFAVRLVIATFCSRENDQDLIAKIAAASEHDDDDDQVRAGGIGRKSSPEGTYMMKGKGEGIK